jgi:Holliday junction resolvase RusA-like endonuclease
MEDRFVTFYKNPNIDYLFALHGIKVPTKQDGFRPVEMMKVNEDGEEEKFNYFYERNPDKKSVEEFHKELKELSSEVFEKDGPILKPHLVEVILEISITEKRFKEVDVDNLAKAVLDGLNGIAFEDDSQVSSLICNKRIHPEKVNAIFIGVTKITEANRGYCEKLYLYSERNNYWEKG